MFARFSTLLERSGVMLAGAALFAIMALTFFDVLGRKFLSNSIPGSLELTELLMVAVIFGALPAVSRRGEHVQFDSLDAWLPPVARAVQKAVVGVAATGLLLALAWIMWVTGGQFAESGETTARIGIPKAPFIYAMAVLCAAAALMHVGALADDDAGASQADEGTAL
jgi:TRAP-type C4-dicarboxylate transport system permease small subunit